MPARPLTITAGGHPRAGPSVSARMTPARPTAASSAPGTSSVPVASSSRVSGTAARVTTTTTTANGKLIKNTNRQPHGARPTSTPPSTGPRAVATPPESGPGPDGGRPVGPPEHRLEDGQRSRGEQGRAHSLEGAHGNEHPGGRRESTAGRRQREPDDAHQEYPPATKPITQRPAQQQQTGQGERVGVDRPLQAGQSGAEVLPDSRQRDVDHAAVELSQPTAEDRREEHEAALRGSVSEIGMYDHMPSSGWRRVCLQPTTRHGHRVAAGLRNR